MRVVLNKLVTLTHNPISRTTRRIFDILDFIPTCGEPAPSDGELACQCGGDLHQGGQVAILATKRRRVVILGGFQGGKTIVLIFKATDYLNDDIGKWQPCVINNRVPADCPGHEGPQYAHLVRGRCDRTLLYWVAAKTYQLTELEFLGFQNNLIGLGMPIKPTTRTDPGSFTVHYPGERHPRIRVETKSERDAETAFSRVSPHGILIAEAGQIQFSSYSSMNERTAGKNGWLLMAGTIEDSQPWYASLGAAWEFEDDDRISFSLATYSNTALFKLGRRDPAILQLEEESTDDRWAQRVEGRQIPPKGLRFKSFSIEHHVRNVYYHPGNEIYVWVDPGYQRGEAAHAVHAAHIMNGQIQVFEELHEYGMITDDVIDWCEERPWWNEKKTLAIDPWYKSVHHSMGSVEEAWRKRTGLICSVKNKRVPINEGDNRLDDMLRVRFDPITGTMRPKIVWSPQCKGVIGELGGIPSKHSRNGEILAYSWNTDSAGNRIGGSPVSRYCDGIRADTAGIIEHFGRAILHNKAGTVRHY